MLLQKQRNASYGCKWSQKLLARVIRLRDTLGQLEKSIQEKHLSCCIFPELQGVEEIVKALRRLSQSRTGALIALERTSNLDNYVRSGTALDARLGASLLISLFYPGNPLHDGGVIIRDASILAAGCVLPLSANDALFKLKGLGMRHRAAVGLSQVSDAIVFVVSEETGTISMASGGQLSENILDHRQHDLIDLRDTTTYMEDAPDTEPLTQRQLSS